MVEGMKAVKEYNGQVTDLSELPGRGNEGPGRCRRPRCSRRADRADQGHPHQAPQRRRRCAGAECRALQRAGQDLQSARQTRRADPCRSGFSLTLLPFYVKRGLTRTKVRPAPLKSRTAPPMTPVTTAGVSGGARTLETDYENQRQSGYRNRRIGDRARLVLDRRARGLLVSEASRDDAGRQDRLRGGNARGHAGVQELQRGSERVRRAASSRRPRPRRPARRS